MRRSAYPLTVTALLVTALLAGCGEDGPASADDPAASPASEDAGTPADTTTSDGPSEATTDPTADAAPTHDYPRRLKLITISEPAEGATVSGTFTAAGKANSFEATVDWRVLDRSGEEVLTGFATAEGWMDKLYAWRTEVDVSSLEPGSYVFVAATADPSGGAEGNGPEEVGAGIVVE